MGTRGVWGFKKGFGYKATYNHFDSYPEGLGLAVIKFIKETSVETMNDIYNRIILVDRTDEATQEQIDECLPFADTNVDDGSLKNWYVLLRDTQGKPELYKTTNLRYMIASMNFIKDDWCEYCYIIDLDEEALLVYVNEFHRAMNIKFETIREQSIYEIVKRMEEFLRMRYGCPV